MLSFTDVKEASWSKIIRDDTSFPLQFNIANEDFKNFKTAVSGVVESNLGLLDEVPLPKNLHLEEVKEYFRNLIKSDLEKDVLFEKSVEISKYANNMYKLMNSYFGEIFDYCEERQKKLSLDVFCVSKMFLNSDLPMPFLRSIENSILAERDYIAIFVRKIRYERMSLIRNRNNRTKFQRVCNAHNSWVGGFSERSVEMERARVRLIWYADFNNSANLDEFFKDKTIKTSLLDEKILDDFIGALQNQVREMERLSAPMMEVSSFLPSEVDQGTKTIRTIMQLLGQKV